MARMESGSDDHLLGSAIFSSCCSPPASSAALIITAHCRLRSFHRGQHCGWQRAAPVCQGANRAPRQDASGKNERHSTTSKFRMATAILSGACSKRTLTALAREARRSLGRISTQKTPEEGGVMKISGHATWQINIGLWRVQRRRVVLHCCPISYGGLCCYATQTRQRLL